MKFFSGTHYANNAPRKLDSDKQISRHEQSFACSLTGSSTFDDANSTSYGDWAFFNASWTSETHHVEVCTSEGWSRCDGASSSFPDVGDADVQNHVAVGLISDADVHVASKPKGKLLKWSDILNRNRWIADSYIGDPVQSRSDRIGVEQLNPLRHRPSPLTIEKAQPHTSIPALNFPCMTGKPGHLKAPVMRILSQLSVDELERMLAVWNLNLGSTDSLIKCSDYLERCGGISSVLEPRILVAPSLIFVTMETVEAVSSAMKVVSFQVKGDTSIQMCRVGDLMKAFGSFVDI
eukprot:TRINITY_DN3408_c0_g1_i2.p1 TRINITY_DN3408_c0_g1~~TRINITY_DN3408_c0_g1_i2.p1  ORF type:complete len:292 (+),score=16.11 TRINITY_DN3408_c0_g1_i2:77-952(+)